MSDISGKVLEVISSFDATRFSLVYTRLRTCISSGRATQKVHMGRGILSIESKRVAGWTC
jgi:hypothetical protein